MTTKYTGAVLGPQEVQAAVEALELVLGDYEGQYWDSEGHDSPEDWVTAREQYMEWVALYIKFTGRSWLGGKHQWDLMGPHPVGVVDVIPVYPGTPEWDASEVLLEKQRQKGG